MKKSIVSFPDFQKLDIRVGQVKEAKTIEGSRNLIELAVDLGEDYGTVTILSGILGYYKPEELVGNKYAFIANLEPRRMLGKLSNGMIMAADEEGKPILFKLAKKIKNGSVLR